MKIGLITPPEVIAITPLADLIQHAIQAEQDGFDSFWFVQLPSGGCDVLTTIALAGQQTSRIELGTGVVPTYPRHPLVMAQQALTTQAATNGRLTLGLGLSHQPVVENMMGLSYERPARHMREYLSVLGPLLQQEPVDYEGDFFRVNASMNVPEASPCSVVVAALAPLMLKAAGELADGTVTWMGGPKAIETHVALKINEAAKGAGRPQPRVCVGLPIAVTDDSEAAREYVADKLAIYGQLVNYRRLLDMDGAAGPADIAIMGDEQSVTQQLGDLAEAGATDFIASIFPVGDDANASIQRTRQLLASLSANNSKA
ncbi:MAG: LLM class F420-dependent oxidoreductase [Chloroflexota bacterium]